MKISENTSVSMPVKNMIGIVVGVAMGGTKKVRSVKVSVDGGSSWKRAKFIGPNLGKYAWRQFVLETTLR